MNTNDKQIARNLQFENLSTVWERRRQKIRLRTGEPVYPFGLPELDRITHGVTKGKVTVIAARTSEAKTSFALQAAFGIADKNKTVLYITLEDDSEQIAERIFSNLREVDNQDLIRGRVPDEVLDDPAILKIFESVRFLALQDYGHNFDEIKDAIDSLEPKPEVVFLDYVQMIEQLPKETEYESLSRFAQQCKKFAELNEIALVVISQINRAGAKDGRPQAHHLQGCGRLEQVADLLLILYAPANYGASSYDFDKEKGTGMEECPPDYVEVNIAKNKNGPRNWVVSLRFTGRFYKFEGWRREMSQIETSRKFQGLESGLYMTNSIRHK